MRRLQRMYDYDKDLFLEMNGYDDRRAIRFGFDTLEDLWNANPEIDFGK